VPARPALDDEGDIVLARPVRRGAGVGIAPDLSAGAADTGAVPTPASDRSDEEQPPTADAQPEPSIAADAEGFEQLIGWVPYRRPFRWEDLTDGDGREDLWSINVDGEATR
jgi:hypothetical protein